MDESSFSICITEAIAVLEKPVTDLQTLLRVLSEPLKYLRTPPRTSIQDIHRYIPLVQHAILTKVVPVWHELLEREDACSLLREYFLIVPSTSSEFIAVHAYCSILASPLDAFSLKLLSSLTGNHGIDACYRGIFESGKDLSSTVQSLLWSHCVKYLLALPDKVANANTASSEAFPFLLPESYLPSFVEAVDRLILQLDVGEPTGLENMRYLLEKMVLRGMLPPSKPVIPSVVSYFDLSRERLAERAPHSQVESLIWEAIVQDLTPSFHQCIILSLYGALQLPAEPLQISRTNANVIHSEASHLFHFFGIIPVKDPNFLMMTRICLQLKDWSIGLGRVVLHWVSKLCSGQTTRGALPKSAIDDSLSAFLAQLLDVWTSADHVQRSLLRQHQGLSSLLLFTLKATTNPDAHAQSLSSSEKFIAAIGKYLSHLDPSVRRCGLLVAEVVAEMSGKSLKFGGWDGVGEGREWAKSLRAVINSTESTLQGAEEEIFVPDDKQAAVPISKGSTRSAQTAQYDSDDSLEGYTSDQSGDHGPSEQELADLENDASLRTVPRNNTAVPVYIVQLLALLQPVAKSEGNEEAERQAIALSASEELIRRKRGFGSELDESAAELVRALVKLQDNYDLPMFDKRRQAALCALAVCSPRVTPIAIIDEFFLPSYSLEQRFVMLNALALGARELAGLPVANDSPTSQKPLFPSRKLPPGQHNKYLQAAHAPSEGHANQIHYGLVQDALEKRSDNVVPLTIRSKQLRISPSEFSIHKSIRDHTLSFKDIGAEFFILPFVRRYWGHLADESARESRTRSSERPAGTAMIQNAIILTRFFRTMSVMTHAAQNSPAFLSIIAPEVLEFGLTVGTKRFVLNEEAHDQEAEVICAALELCLVTLTACMELDRGKTLCLDFSSLTLSLKEWCTYIMESFERGVRHVGVGGKSEKDMIKRAVGILVLLGDMMEVWQRSMVSALGR